MKTTKGSASRKQKVIIDYILGTLLIIQVLFQFTPRIVHCVAGIALTVLLVVHIWQHRTWFKALNRGKWNRQRTIKTISVALIALLLITTIILGFSIPDGAGLGQYQGMHQGGYQGGSHGGHHGALQGGHAQNGGLHGQAQPHHFLGYVTLAVCIFHVAVNVRRKKRKTA